MGYNFTKKLILVKIRLEKVDLGEVNIKKEQENFKKRSNAIGGPLHMSHPVHKPCIDYGLRIIFDATRTLKGQNWCTQWICKQICLG